LLKVKEEFDKRAKAAGGYSDKLQTLYDIQSKILKQKFLEPQEIHDSWDTTEERQGKDKTSTETYYANLKAAELALTESEKEKLEIRKSADQEFAELNMTRFDLEREQVELMAEIYRKAGVDRETNARITAKKLADIASAERKQKYDDVQSTVGVMAEGFETISQMGGEYSKEAFAMYKAFKITETLMSTYSGAMKAYEAMAAIPFIGPALGVAAATAVAGFGLAQVAMIKNAQPPSYDQGGISNAEGIYQTGNISEAHIPIPSGGKIPVKINNEKQKQPVQIILNNPVFQDIKTQRQAMAQIAEVIAARVAPGAVVENYSNDGIVRSMVRGGA